MIASYLISIRKGIERKDEKIINKILTKIVTIRSGFLQSNVLMQFTGNGMYVKIQMNDDGTERHFIIHLEHWQDPAHTSSIRCNRSSDEADNESETQVHGGRGRPF